MEFEEIAAGCDEVDLSRLAPSVGTYALCDVKKREADTYIFFSYADGRRSWTALYDDAVKDYTVHVSFPLFYFVDIDFIRRDREAFMECVNAEYMRAVEDTLVHPQRGFTHAYRMSGLPERDVSKSMPERIGELTRGIDPQTAIRGINGSYVIGEYALPDERTGLLFFYNTFRKVFFAERVVNGLRTVIHEFDATGTEEFEDRLLEHLRDMSEGFGRQHG